MKKFAVALSLACAAVIAAPAMAAETLLVPFTQPDGAVTSQLYSGLVHITVSGTGTSLENTPNDAFYLLPSGTLRPGENGYYQLAFGTSVLQALNEGNAAYNFIPTGRPAFNASNTYSFILDTGLTVPGQLHFGVTDGKFSDNTGAFSLTIAAVPEPATWAMMLAGFGMIGFVARRRQPVETTATHA